MQVVSWIILWGFASRRVALFLTLFFTLLLNPAGASKFWTS
jgi:hypothetical protein